MTIKDMKEILNFLDIAKSTTERAIAESSEGSLYGECMKNQLERLNALIKRIEETRI